MEAETTNVARTYDGNRLFLTDTIVSYFKICCGTVCKSKDDVFFMTAVIFMSIGFAMMCIGYIIPRDYVFDPSLPARQMEAIELRYYKLSYSLDLSIIIGMGFIALGGIIVSTHTVYHYITVKGSVYKSRDRRNSTLLNDKNVAMATYGSYNRP